jgi:hypothetical protein
VDLTLFDRKCQIFTTYTCHESRDGLEQVCRKSAPPASVTDRPSAHVKDGVVRTC